MLQRRQITAKLLGGRWSHNEGGGHRGPKCLAKTKLQAVITQKLLLNTVQLLEPEPQPKSQPQKVSPIQETTIMISQPTNSRRPKRNAQFCCSETFRMNRESADQSNPIDYDHLRVNLLKAPRTLLAALSFDSLDPVDAALLCLALEAAEDVSRSSI